MCYRFLFCLVKRQIPHEDKILNPQLAVAPSLRHHRWISSCRRLSRSGPPRALRRAICQYSQRHSCIVHPRAQLLGAAISPMDGEGAAIARSPARTVALGLGRPRDRQYLLIFADTRFTAGAIAAPSCLHLKVSAILWPTPTDVARFTATSPAR